MLSHQLVNEMISKSSKEAGIDFLGVNYGFGFQNIKGYANTPEDIITLL